jgi:hypothetical protein
MKWVIRIVIALFFCFVFFGAIQHYSKLAGLSSAFLAVVLAIFATLAATLDFTKKFYDSLKAPYELRKLQREEAVSEGKNSSLVHSPTADPLRKYGQSVVESTQRIGPGYLLVVTLLPRTFSSAGMRISFAVRVSSSR